jgi:hypothetical protein
VINSLITVCSIAALATERGMLRLLRFTASAIGAEIWSAEIALIMAEFKTVLREISCFYCMPWIQNK